MKYIFVLLIAALLFSGVSAADNCEELEEKIDLILKQNATQNKLIAESSNEVSEAAKLMTDNAGLIKSTNSNQVKFADFLKEMNANLPLRSAILFGAYANVLLAIFVLLVLRGTVYPFVKKTSQELQIKGLKKQVENARELKEENRRLKKELLTAMQDVK
jgi:hypothetical protein